MAAQEKAAPGGCALVILIVIGFWLLTWVLKIGLILLGAALVIAGVVGAIAAVLRLAALRIATSRLRRRAAVFDREMESLAAVSARLLEQEMGAWDRIQGGRGVGTRLERAYFTGTAPPDIQAVLERVNELMTIGEALVGAFGERVGEADRVKLAESADHTWLELEHLRNEVTR